MDALSLYGLIAGIVLGILSAGATFFNKQRFEAQNALLQAGNDELRNQNKDLRDERTDLIAKNAEIKAICESKDIIISNLKRQPNLTQLTKTISNNHREVITLITELTKALVEKKNVES
jgi:hypothetical protein